jgi:hypothetical protein
MTAILDDSTAFVYMNRSAHIDLIWNALVDLSTALVSLTGFQS